MKLNYFLFFVFVIFIGVLFIQCPAQGTGRGGGGSSSSSSSYILSGIYDSTFNNGGAGADNWIYATAIQSDGKILVGGTFTTYNGVNVSDYLMRLNIDGSIDTTFNNVGSGFNDFIWNIKIQKNNKILIGGGFSTYNGVDVPDHIIRLNEDGSVDTTFNNGGFGANNGVVKAIAIQSDGKILIGGDFATYNGINVPWCILRLEEDGSLDLGFNNGGSGANIFIQAITIQSDEKILIGGGFTTYNGVNTPDYIMRLNPNGSIDSTFNNGGSGFDTYVNKIIIQQDGMIIVGGDFTTYNIIDITDGIVRLDTIGALDSTFNNTGLGTWGGSVYGISIQSDGKILLGGNFTTYNNEDVSDYVMRLNTDGTIDSTFNSGGSGANGPVDTVALQSNGMLIIGGRFKTYNGNDVPDYIIRLK